MRPFLLATLCLAIGAGISPSAELTCGNTVLATDEPGCGFVDRVDFAGRTVVQARPDSVGAFIRVARAGDGSLDSLFPNAVDTVLAARVEGVEGRPEQIVQTGAYIDGDLRLPFTRRLTAAGTNAIEVHEQVDGSLLPDDLCIAEHRLMLPLVFGEDEHLRMLGVGGAEKAELFRMDMSDVTHRQQSISAPPSPPAILGHRGATAAVR